MIELIVDIIKLLLAIGIGSIIGIEREKSGKPAGLRTLSLVCMGSTFIALITLKYFPQETARVLAGVITGIGFLGAGAIIAHGGNVRGLTTAAAIWAISIIGMGIGIGEYVISIVFTVLVYLILIERKIKEDIIEAEEKIKKKRI